VGGRETENQAKRDEGGNSCCLLGVKHSERSSSESPFCIVTIDDVDILAGFAENTSDGVPTPVAKGYRRQEADVLQAELAVKGAERVRGRGAD
jgi:hypothetical protein